MRTTCCLNLPPPTSSTQAFNTPLSTKPPQLPLVMGLQMGNLVISDEEGIALALPPHHHVPTVERSKAPNPKWSDKIRACPSWRQNSLETVVPENLPRPASRRRYEAVRSTTAPSLTLPVQTKTDCFSM
ncbi:uncharacterized protein G2W53_012578 [Senna tora]|uniref:Uncharacterized protein n=1 Tax=Senna tora TaxID=362788 RepID=A0A834U1I4_9FABA|nr:uncharacterized protein G2W53_012578 [Senna tora]